MFNSFSAESKDYNHELNGKIIYKMPLSCKFIKSKFVKFDVLIDINK